MKRARGGGFFGARVAEGSERCRRSERKSFAEREEEVFGGVRGGFFRWEEEVCKADREEEVFWGASGGVLEKFRGPSGVFWGARGGDNFAEREDEVFSMR